MPVQKQEQTAPAKTDAGHHQEAPHSDFCSPFCQCSCCAVACVLPPAVAIPAPEKPAATGKTVSAHLQQKPIGISIPVWQPPRLG